MLGVTICFCKNFYSVVKLNSMRKTNKNILRYRIFIGTDVIIPFICPPFNQKDVCDSIKLYKHIVIISVFQQESINIEHPELILF